MIKRDANLLPVEEEKKLRSRCRAGDSEAIEQWREHGPYHPLVWEMKRAERKGRELLVWDRVKDRIDPLFDEIGAVLDTLAENERRDVESYMITFVDDWLLRREP
jgi:hypothetical protein